MSIEDIGKASSDHIDSLYGEAYGEIYGKGPIGFVSKLAHKTLETPFVRDKFFPRTIELGAGNGQHLSFVRHGFREYFETDIRAEHLPERKTASDDSRVIQLKQDASSLQNFPDGHFDRLIATCLFAHLPDPPSAIIEWFRVVRSAGFLSIYLPVDPGAMLRFTQRVSVVPAAKKRGIDYWKVHHEEHPFHFEFLLQTIRNAAGNSRLDLKFFPFRVKSWNANLWAVIHIEKP